MDMLSLSTLYKTITCLPYSLGKVFVQFHFLRLRRTHANSKNISSTGWNWKRTALHPRKFIHYTTQKMSTSNKRAWNQWENEKFGVRNLRRVTRLGPHRQNSSPRTRERLLPAVVLWLANFTCSKCPNLGGESPLARVIPSFEIPHQTFFWGGYSASHHITIALITIANPENPLNIFIIVVDALFEKDTSTHTTHRTQFTLEFELIYIFVETILPARANRILATSSRSPTKVDLVFGTRLKILFFFFFHSH